MNSSLKKHITILTLLAISFTFAHGQGKADLEKIAASQEASSPLIYTTAHEEIPTIKPGNYQNEKECTPRNGLPNFFQKIQKNENVTVAFIGGSITQGKYCYRLQISQYMEKHFSGSRIKWINAGVSGTGTDLGAFRIQEQVLQYNPDLIFIEFAVNGGYPDGMEGMIRKVRKQNPHTDICLIYTIYNGQTVAYQKEEVPQVIKALEEIADHYQLPSIHLGMEAAQLEKENKLLWKGTQEEAAGRILFSHDGVHPITDGGNLYASAIARGLGKIKEAKSLSSEQSLPEALISSAWEEANMYPPDQIASFDTNWKKIATNNFTHLKPFSGWFDSVMTSSKESATFSFQFEGDLFGFFDIGGPEVGQLEIFVNDKPVKLKPMNIRGVHLFQANAETGDSLLNRFNIHCNNRYRGQYDVIQLEKGTHRVSVRIYDQSVIYLGRILLRGKPINPTPQQPALTQQQKWEKKIERYVSRCSYCMFTDPSALWAPPLCRGGRAARCFPLPRGSMCCIASSPAKGRCPKGGGVCKRKTSSN